MFNDEQVQSIECAKCKTKVHLQTSANQGDNWKAQNAVDINRQVVFSACEMGVGREAITVMCDILNMPVPCPTNLGMTIHKLSAMSIRKL